MYDINLKGCKMIALRALGISFVMTALYSMGLAQDAGAAEGPSLLPMLISYAPILFIFIIFYILIIKPQNQAAKAHAELIKNLSKGDVVLTEGGVIGEIVALKDTFVHIRINPEDQLAVMRGAVKKVLGSEEAKGWEPAAATKPKR